MWSCKTSLELPHVIDNEIVGYVPDVDCTVCLNEDGALWKLILPVWKSDRMITKLSGIEFDVAREHVEANKTVLMAEARVPSRPVHRPSPPIRGVGFRGGKYAA